MNPAPPKFYYTYVLGSKKRSWIYVGVTIDLKKRMEQHHSGKSCATRKYLPVELVYYEAYRSLVDANNREKSLKQYGGALRQLKKRIKQSLIKGGAG
jgi:putative endonuclease